ncbi:hypothetical protein Dfri01_66400 [Dyadobacter frigoris]|nr:hypothetical protein Dfri01_66400 [Dyadobacter frigoris]
MNVDLMAAHPSPSRVALQDGDISRAVPTQKLIKEGFVEFETSDVEKTKAQIMAATSANNAYISSDKQNNVADKVSYTLIVRIPASKFDSFLNSATKDVRYFDHKQIDVKDVTAEYFDVETRLKTKKEIELRYRELLKKASTIKDILSIETELGTIRTEIESAEGQLKLLADQVQYSTLRIEFYKITSTPAVFTYQLSSAFSKGWENLLTILILAVDIWPFILLGIGLWFGFRKFAKRKSVKKEADMTI